MTYSCLVGTGKSENVLNGEVLKAKLAQPTFIRFAWKEMKAQVEI